MSLEPELSVVIPTYNRLQTLQRALLHLAKQDIDAHRFEVIVVDDASPEDTLRAVEEVRPELPFELRCYRNENNLGPGGTQNRGIRDARAPLLMLMTDDIFMEPDVLRLHLDFHAERPERETAALGKVLQSPELRGTALMRKWDPFRYWLLEKDEELPYYRFWACNISCKREFMLEAGMFQEDLGRGGAAAMEDLEVGYRLSLNGMHLYYLRDALGYHYHPYTIESASKRWHERGLNYGEFRKCTPPAMDVYHHVLNRHTFRDYVRVLREENTFQGLEAKLWYHLVREALRRTLLNRFTAVLIWRPLFAAAEKYTWLERLATRQTYRAFFYYNFLRGVSDAQSRYGD